MERLLLFAVYPIEKGVFMRERKTIRLKEYDYSKKGMYFITICTKNREYILGEIVGNDALVVPSHIGQRIVECWNNIGKVNEKIYTGEFILMPNHIHGIIIIDNPEILEEERYVFGVAERRGRRSLQGIIKDFKSVTTRIYNRNIGEGEIKNQLWQKSYYEHIIRNEKELHKIIEYIRYNPLNWSKDSHNTE